MKSFLIVLTVFLSIQSLAQKKVLDHSNFDSWESIKEISIQPNGQYVSYVVSPQEGDGNLIIRNKSSSQILYIPRATQAVFTEDGQYLLAKIKPTFLEIRKSY